MCRFDVNPGEGFAFVQTVNMKAKHSLDVRLIDAIKHITDFSFTRQHTGALCIQHSPTAAVRSTNTAFE